LQNPAVLNLPEFPLNIAGFRRSFHIFNVCEVLSKFSAKDAHRHFLPLVAVVAFHFISSIEYGCCPGGCPGQQKGRGFWPLYVINGWQCSFKPSGIMPGIVNGQL
jgi:hypothetical protein